MLSTPGPHPPNQVIYAFKYNVSNVASTLSLSTLSSLRSVFDVWCLAPSGVLTNNVKSWSICLDKKHWLTGLTCKDKNTQMFNEEKTWTIFDSISWGLKKRFLSFLPLRNHLSCSCLYSWRHTPIFFPIKAPFFQVIVPGAQFFPVLHFFREEENPTFLSFWLFIRNCDKSLVIRL